MNNDELTIWVKQNARYIKHWQGSPEFHLETCLRQMAEILIAKVSQESVRSEALQKRENEIWEEVVEICLRAWPGQNVFYDQSPIELITRLINERDEALQSPARVAEGGACPRPQVMGEHACKDRTQCWEPCGDLGHHEEYARPDPESPAKEQPGEQECKGRYTDEQHDHWACICGASWWNKCPLRQPPPPERP